MILSLIVVVLILAITAYQTLFGFFSGIINLFCTIAAAAVAYGYWLPLTLLLSDQGLHPAYAEPASFAGLFLVTGFALRGIADKLIRGNVMLPRPVDLAGAVVFGLINALIYMGVLVSSLLMLPWGEGSFLMYSRFERTEDKTDQGLVEFEQNAASFFRPDEFTAGLIEVLSSGSLAAGTPLDRVFPDFAEWVKWTSNTVQAASSPAPIRDEDGDGFKDGLAVVGWRTVGTSVEGWYADRYPERGRRAPGREALTYRAEPGNELLKVRLNLREAAADRGGRNALHLFRPTMIRVVGEVNGEPVQYRPVALGNVEPEVGGAPLIVDPDINLSRQAQGETIVDAYFEVSEGFTPRFVEYRRHARAPLIAANRQEEEFAALDPLLTRDEQERRERVQRVGFMGAVNENRSGVRTQLPVEIDPIRADNVEIEDMKFASGRVAGAEEELRGSGQADRISQFAVPENLRLLQINFRPVDAQSLPGQVFSFVGTVTNQYAAVDSTGTEYPLVGYYAKVDRARQEFYEIYYAGDPDSPEAVSFRHLLDFKHIEGRELRTQASDPEVGLLFLIPPGKQITKVQNQAGRSFEVEFRT